LKQGYNVQEIGVIDDAFSDKTDDVVKTIPQTFVTIISNQQVLPKCQQPWL
jgi:hypothetical protein